MTIGSVQFCAVDSAKIGDPLVGTAAHATRNLLISWPRPKWVRSLREASDMTDEVKNLLAEIASVQRRVNLIHRREQPSHLHRVVLMPECLSFDVARKQLPEFLQSLVDGRSLGHWQTDRVEGSMILCCTHGKKDKCCAKFGYRSYKALARAAQEHEHPFDVWESTHLGGCRLAASVVVFPALRKYGRIAADNVVPFLTAEAKDCPYLPCYRGDSALTPPAQCAQIAALEWLGKRAIVGTVTVDEGLRRVDASNLRLLVHWQAADQKGTLEVACGASELIRCDTCADYEPDGAQPRRVWRATTVVERGRWYSRGVCAL